LSGFTRDPLHYGDRLVYVALTGTWDGYHRRYCGCRGDWVTEHAEPAGLRVVRDGGGFVALVGPGLTEGDGLDESALSTGALWTAVTGQPADPTAYRHAVQVVERGASRGGRAGAARRR
jgi:hypothetical protein